MGCRLPSGMGYDLFEATFFSLELFQEGRDVIEVEGFELQDFQQLEACVFLSHRGFWEVHHSLLDCDTLDMDPCLGSCHLEDSTLIFLLFPNLPLLKGQGP